MNVEELRELLAKAEAEAGPELENIEASGQEAKARPRFPGVTLEGLPSRDQDMIRAEFGGRGLSDDAMLSAWFDKYCGGS